MKAKTFSYFRCFATLVPNNVRNEKFLNGTLESLEGNCISSDIHMNDVFPFHFGNHVYLKGHVCCVG